MSLQERCSRNHKKIKTANTRKNKQSTKSQMEKKNHMDQNTAQRKCKSKRSKIIHWTHKQPLPHQSPFKDNQQKYSKNHLELYGKHVTNYKLQKSKNEQTTCTNKTCNCNAKNNSSLNGKFFLNNVIYQGTVKSADHISWPDDYV